MKRIFCLLGLTALLLCGCEPTFDTQNEASFQRSVAEMTKNMTVKQKEEFLGAIEIVKSIYIDKHPNATPEDIRGQFKDWTAAQLYQRARFELQ